MENDAIVQRLERLEAKIDATYESAHKTYRIMYWTGIVTIAFLALSLVSLLFLPFLIGPFLSAEGVGGLGGF